ncbi:MAG: hypothetical protein QOD39_947, partial [Mycobacterium sp.]|nr:hypothetical protein [Mycobacterium sp.]
MKHSTYIGRVGALAVALGIGAAVVTTPGIALAQESDSDSANVGAESPSNPQPNDSDAPSPGADGSDGNDGDDGSTANTDPPDMNIDNTSVDTSTNDGSAGASGDDDEEAVAGADGDDGAADIDDPSGEAPGNPPAGNESQTPPAGNGSSQGSQQNNENAGTPQQPSNNDNGDDNSDLTGASGTTGGGADDNAGAASFRSAALDNSSSGASTFSSLSLTEEAAPDPISSLITLPFRFVSSVLTAFIGGGTDTPGENPLFLGLLAFVRRQFGTFDRTFTNHAPQITGALVDENEDGTFTITVRPTDASDPDGDDLTFSAIDGLEGSVEQTGANTFKYTPGADFDGGDTITLTVSDPGGLFGVNRKTDSIDVDIVHENTDPTQPEDPQPPVQQDDGTVETELQFDPAKVTNVTIAPGSEPKYYTYEESYNEETGQYELHLTPTQAGQLRAALGLTTEDSVGLQVTTAEAPQTIQTFALRSASFAALAAPDYTVNLPDIPAGHFEVGDPIFTSPHDTNPEQSYPAGVVVTDRYAYVLSSHLLASGAHGLTVTVIGSDPEKADYHTVIEEIPVGGSALIGQLAGDKLYIANTGGSLSVIDTDGADPNSEADDNT